MKFFILLSIIALCHCRPQDGIQNSGVEVEKQTLIELPKEQESRSLAHDEERRREEMTKQILEKIAEVNNNHGLKPKIIKRPSFYSAHKAHQLQQEDKQPKQLPNFQFSNTPFTNPIFEYLQNQNNVKQNNFNTKTTLNEKEDEIPEGYAIKRKVTHQQTVIIPNYQQLPDPYQMQMPFGSVPMGNQFNPMQQGGHYGLVPLNEQNFPSPDMQYSEKKHDQKNNSLDELTLAKQNYLINNIKNIISNSQNGAVGYQNPYGGYIPNPNPNPYYNPYPQPVMDPYNSYRINPYINPYNPYVNPIPNQKNSDTYYANLQAEKEQKTNLDSSQNNAVESRQLQGPFSQIFPIVIKNPLQQMFQAITSMIEYGPAADLCRSHQGHDDIHRQVDEEIQRSQSTTRSGKSINSTPSTTNLPNTKPKPANTDQNEDEFSIEGLQIVDQKRTKTSKNNTQNVERREMDNDDDDDDEVLIEEDKFFKKPEAVTAVEPVPMVPGNGIFIQKLKVRKGGVAIAGPGGIATAGSGGTAIVGPNGYAYTQPNGVAIAGPGSRVISVDPDVNLNEFVQNMTKDGSVSRLGKLVAIGPIVYHDLGQN